MMAVQKRTADGHPSLLPHLLSNALGLFRAAVQGSPYSRAIQSQVHQSPQDVHSLLKAQLIVFMDFEVLKPALPNINLALLKPGDSVTQSRLWKANGQNFADNQQRGRRCR